MMVYISNKRVIYRAIHALSIETRVSFNSANVHGTYSCTQPKDILSDPIFSRCPANLESKLKLAVAVNLSAYVLEI